MELYIGKNVSFLNRIVHTLVTGIFPDERSDRWTYNPFTDGKKLRLPSDTNLTRLLYQIQLVDETKNLRP